MAGFGAPKHGGNFKTSPKSLPKEGSLTCRILPPIEGHKNFETGEWAVPHTQHFGYDTPRPDDQSKRKFNVFYCVERIKWEDGQKVVLQACPEDDLIEEKKAEYEQRKAEMEKRKVPEAEIKATLKPLVDWLMRHNRDFKYYVNVKDVNGEYYTLKVPNKVKKGVDKLCKEYREKKPSLDLIAADQGVWFIITRTGKGFQTEYDVKLVMEEVNHNGETFQKVKKAPLTEADANAALEKCWDLTNVGIRKLPLEKVNLLVESGGDEETVEAIFKSSERREGSSEQSPATSPQTAPQTQAPAAQQAPASQTAPAARAAPAPQTQTAPPVEARNEPKASESASNALPSTQPTADIDDEEAAALKALEVAKARKAARLAAAAAASAPVSSPPQAPPVAPPVVPTDDGGPCPDEDEDAFLAQFRTS